MNEQDLRRAADPPEEWWLVQRLARSGRIHPSRREWVLVWLVFLAQREHRRFRRLLRRSLRGRS